MQNAPANAPRLGFFAALPLRGDFFWRRLVAFYCIARACVWTLVLWITQPALPLDVLEHLAWGREWRVVYANHPGLPAWINEAVNAAFGGSHLALAATAPAATSAAMWAAYLLARRLATSPFAAAAAALALEGVYYFNAAATEFNHNTAQLTACAFLAWATHAAFLPAGGRAGWRRWLVLGVVAAAAMHAKYSSVLWLAAFLAWSVAEPTARRAWRGAGVWLALTVFAVVNAPQAAALAELDFAPLQFALERAKHSGEWTAHLLNPLRFLAAQLAACLLALLLCWLAGARRRAALPAAARANGGFVVVAAFAPLLIALALSAVFGWRLRSMWGAAMPAFLPLFWFFFYMPAPAAAARFARAVLAVALAALLAAASVNFFAPFVAERGKRVHTPGRALGEGVERLWRGHFANLPLQYVVGNKHTAAAAAFYAPSRPSAILGEDWQKNFWATPKQVAAAGGVFVWVVDDGKRQNARPPGFAAQFRAVGAAVTLTLRWQTPAKIPPYKVGAFVFAPDI